MICRALLLAAVLFLLAPGVSKAQTTIVEPTGSHFPYQRWVDEARMPTPNVTITLEETGASHGCPRREQNYAGCTVPSENLMWLAPETIAGVARHIFYHELGHNVDVDLLPEWMRWRFMAIMRLAGEWIGSGEPVSSLSPNEQFAEVYADCAILPYVSAGEQLGRGPILGADPIGGRVRHNQICRMLGKL